MLFFVALSLVLYYQYSIESQKLNTLYEKQVNSIARALDNNIGNVSTYTLELHNLTSEYLKNNELTDFSTDFPTFKNIFTYHQEKNFLRLNSDAVFARTKNYGDMFIVGDLNELDNRMAKYIHASYNAQSFQYAFHSNNEYVTLSYFFVQSKFVSIYPKIPIEDILDKHPSLVSWLDYAYEVYNEFASPAKNLQGNLFWTKAYFDRAQNGMMVTSAKPVYDNEKYIGVVGVDVILKFLDTFVETNNTLPGNAVIISNFDQVLVATDLNYQTEADIVTKDAYFKEKQDAVSFEYRLSSAPWVYKLFIDKSTYRNNVLENMGTLIVFSFILLLLIPVTTLIIYQVYVLPKIRYQHNLEAKNIELDKLNREKEKNLKEIKRYQEKIIAQKKLAALGRLGSGMSHELKNPLNIINNSSKVLEDIVDSISQKNIPEEFNQDMSSLKKLSEMIYKNGVRANEILMGMMSKFNKTTSEISENDLSNLVQKSILFAKEAKNEKIKTFGIHIQEDIEKNILFKCRPQDIERIVINLLENAIDAVAQKYQNKQIESPLIKLELHQIKTKIIFQIRDNGMGIKPELEEQVLEPFFTTKPTGEGTGLGLSIVYDIVTALDGELIITSKENDFTEIKIKLKKTS